MNPKVNVGGDGAGDVGYKCNTRFDCGTGAGTSAGARTGDAGAAVEPVAVEAAT